MDLRQHLPLHNDMLIELAYSIKLTQNWHCAMRN